MMETLDESPRKKLQPNGPHPAPAMDGLLSLVNNTIYRFQSFHKVIPLRARKTMSLERNTELSGQNSPAEGGSSPKVKILRALSTEDILNSVNNSLAKMHAPKLTNVWEHCCNEVEQEIVELNKLLEKLELPPSNYKKEKSFPWEVYKTLPNLNECKTQDFLDFYIFPFLLPAVHSLLDFAKENRVFQCRYITFNSIDYIIEHLYNSNPLHPERREKPMTIDEISYKNNWHSKFPRAPLPKWLTMSEDAAAIKIQRAFRGFITRMRPDVSEMRQFWKDYKSDLAREGRKSSTDPSITPTDIDSFHDLHVQEEEIESELNIAPHETHSDVCLLCNRYREFFVQQDVLEEARSRAREEEERLLLELDSEEEEYLEQPLSAMSSTSISPGSKF